MDKDRIELTFTGLAYPGQAFGRDEEGRMVFAPFGLPGERAILEVSERHKRWAHARIVEILEPSPNRISPRCQHYGQCGGCHYQHLPYEAQVKIKSDIIHSQLERLGGIQNPPLSPIIPSPSPWHTRNHVQFSLDANGRLGFHAPQSEDIVLIEECHLPNADLLHLWSRLEIGEASRLERVALRAGSNGELMVVFHGESDPDIELESDLPASIIWLSQDNMFVLAGESHIFIDVLERPFRVSADSFFQVHTELAPQLVRQALSLLDPQPNETIFDLYSGVGLFSAFMADSSGRIIAVEESPWATEDFVNNLDPFDNVDLYEASIEVALPALSVRPQKVLVDPPRAGLGREVVEQLVAKSPDRLVYVSCDPATFARDAKMFIDAGYHLESVTPIDLFPQTYHIETISLFIR
jgi:23S rRNA (uracil1939-C5)-methyltransferase